VLVAEALEVGGEQAVGHDSDGVDLAQGFDLVGGVAALEAC